MARAGQRTIVLKVGSSSIVDDSTGFLRISNLSTLVETVCALKRNGDRVVVVSSGAIGVGMVRLGLKARPKVMAQKQAAAAVGQGRLMRVYDDLFSQLGQPIAQVLLTRNDLLERTNYLNAVSTLKELLAMGVVPIVNENDTVSTAEIRFGDNDTLSALIAGMIEAQWLFLLTDVDALYTANPRTNPDAAPIRIVKDLEFLQVSTDGSGSSLGTGGMQTKLTAAALATAAGCATAICRSDRPADIQRIISGEEVGTVFLPKEKPMGDRRWWIKHGLHCFGRLVIDAGAAVAVGRHKSLFAAGIVKVEKTFTAQSCVSIVTTDGVEVARGITNYASSEIERVRGKRSSDIETILGYVESDCIVDRHNIVLSSTPMQTTANSSQDGLVPEATSELHE